MAIYQLSIAGCVVRLEDNAFIPPDPDNIDYAEYLRWLGEGNEPLPPPEPLPPSAPLTTEEKLQAVGLTAAELRELLGLPMPE